jgi:hypothetical protein
MVEGVSIRKWSGRLTALLTQPDLGSLSDVGPHRGSTQGKRPERQRLLDGASVGRKIRAVRGTQTGVPPEAFCRKAGRRQTEQSKLSRWRQPPALPEEEFLTGVLRRVCGLLRGFP